MTNVQSVSDALGEVQATEPAAALSPSFLPRLKHAAQIVHLAWGTAWFVGLGLMFLQDGPGGRRFVALPAWLPLTALMVLLVVAGAVTATLGVRVFGRGAVDARTAQQAKWYGSAWLFAFVGLMLAIGTITRPLSHDAAGLVWGATTTGLVGALHMAGSAIWTDPAQRRMGMWITFVNVVGAVSGHGWQSLAICLGGGLVSIVQGGYGLLHEWNAR
jgi:hypothetical protein